MANNLMKRLSTEDFDPHSYVRELTLQCNGVDDLLSTRDRIHKLSEETNAMLKKNVYKNYTQFIDTAKEISFLESEMYQLSHMLTEQQDVLNSVLDISIAGGKSFDSTEKLGKVEESHYKSLSSLLEKVEGCGAVLDEKKRSVVHCGELLELDLTELRFIEKIYCVLLTDGFLTAQKCGRTRSPIQYKFQTVYELDNLAVVNIKDDATVRNAFKILVFPDSRMFQAPNQAIKEEWLSMVEQAKRKKMSIFKRQLSLSDSRNPFEDEEDDEGLPYEDSGSGSFDKDSESEAPNWLMELPEDLDVCIAQREFEEAVDLISKANQHLASYPKLPNGKEIKAKIDGRAKQLIEILKNELKVSPDRSIHGGPRAARRAVAVLLSLGKSPIACDLFLKHRSAHLKHALKQQTMGAATTTYIEKLCSVFFGGLIEAGNEFNKAFSNSNSSASSFVIWTKKELQNFVQMFSRHVFTPQVNASVSAECISHARVHCDRLSEIGIDLSFELNNLLQVYVEGLITEIKDKLLEAIKLRSSDDKWRPQNFQSISNLKKFIDDMKEFNIEGIEPFIHDECWVTLTSNSIAFGKTYLNFVDDLLKLHTSPVHKLINEALAITFQAQILHITSAYQNASDSSEKQFISKNSSFLHDCILPVAEKNYRKKLGLVFPRIIELKADLAKFHSTSVTSKYSPTVYV